MSWRDSLGKSKYKTPKRRRNSKIGKAIATLALLCVVSLVFYQSGVLQSFYEKMYERMNPEPEKIVETIVETKIIETTVVEPIIIEKVSTETVVLMPEGNWYKYDTANSQYQPVSDMPALIQQIHVTELGQEILDKTELRFTSEDDIVNQSESLKGENVIILGLWKYRVYKGVSSEEILLLAPNDELYERCGSNPKVILMHELLHSIDYNDDSFDADDFGPELARMYPDVYSEITMIGYKDENIADELFARVGSEKTDAPQAVKDIYAKYFEEWSMR